MWEVPPSNACVAAAMVLLLEIVPTEVEVEATAVTCGTVDELAETAGGAGSCPVPLSAAAVVSAVIAARNK